MPFHAATKPLPHSPEQGADTIVRLAAAAPDRCSGTFWHDRAVRPTHLSAPTRDTAHDRRALWNPCERSSAPFLTEP